MTHLARDFAMSDAALHKIWKRHDIPKPPPGFWVKQEAGWIDQVVRARPLS
jgi:hypothetical protein